MDMDRLTDFSGWRILNTRHKYLCANGTSLGHLSATLALVKEYHIKPDDVASVRIKTCPKEARHTTTFTKKYPRTAENADHSSFYQTAFAIKEGNFGLDSIKPENFTDPVILELIEKITVESDPKLPEMSYAGTTEIMTRDGRKLEKYIDCAHGFGDDPLSDIELEQKFRDMATRYLTEKHIRKIIDTCWNVEQLDDIGELAKLMVIPKQ
jgi:2-methylcitrate dehydratase PrpD